MGACFSAGKPATGYGGALKTCCSARVTCILRADAQPDPHVPRAPCVWLIQSACAGYGQQQPGAYGNSYGAAPTSYTQNNGYTPQTGGKPSDAKVTGAQGCRRSRSAAAQHMNTAHIDTAHVSTIVPCRCCNRLPIPGRLPSGFWRSLSSLWRPAAVRSRTRRLPAIRRRRPVPSLRRCRLSTAAIWRLPSRSATCAHADTKCHDVLLLLLTAPGAD